MLTMDKTGEQKRLGFFRLLPVLRHLKSLPILARHPVLSHRFLASLIQQSAQVQTRRLLQHMKLILCGTACRFTKAWP